MNQESIDRSLRALSTALNSADEAAEAGNYAQAVYRAQIATVAVLTAIYGVLSQ